MADIDYKSLHVLIVTTSFPVGNNLASGVFIKRLSDALSRRVQIKVLTPSPSSTESDKFVYSVHYFRYAPRKLQILAHNPGGIPVALRSNRRNLILLPVFVIAMFIAVLKDGKKSDVIHANWSVPGLISALAALVIKKPVITTLRGSDVKGMEGSFSTRLIINMVLRLSNRVVSVSNNIHEELCKRWPSLQHKIIFIPNGVDEDFFRIKRGNNHHNFVHLLTIGNLVANKDVFAIVQAFSKLDSSAMLTIVGDGRERAKLERMCEELGITNRVKFTGIVTPDRIKEELCISDIFILASHSEGRPNVVLEAMAAGCAVVATNLPGISEFIENKNQGLLFPPGDTQTLQSLLKKLVSDPDLTRQLGAEARIKIKNMDLTWDRCAKDYINQYIASLNSWPHN